MLNARRLLCAAALVAALVPAPSAFAAGTPYVLTWSAPSDLEITPIPGGSTLAITVTEAGGSVAIAPAITSSPPGCTSTLTATSCPASMSSNVLRIDAAVIDVDVTGVTTGTLELNGGPDADRVSVTNATVTSNLALVTERGSDSVQIAGGSIAAMTDVLGGDTGDDVWAVDAPALAGTLATGAGDDRVLTTTPMRLEGGDGADVLTGPGQLDGGEGPDVLRPRQPAQTVSGGSGADRVSFEGTSAPLTIVRSAGGGARVNGSAVENITGVEEVEGGDANDVLTGSDPAGSDTGVDVLRGGRGDDVLRGRGAADVLDGGPDTDTITYSELSVGSGVRVDLPAGTGGPTGDATARDAISAVEHVIATPGADVLIGTDAAETFEGSEGMDRIESAGGDDVVDAGSGAGAVNAGPGNDIVTTDLASGFADAISSGAGNDTVRTGPGDDLLRGGSGTDALDGGAGNDTVTYDERPAGEPVTVSIDAAADDGAPGENDILTSIESVTATPGADTITGDDGPNSIEGGAGNDRLIGRGGTDTLSGSAGRDILDGGAGSDVLLGGADEDRLHGFDGFADALDCGAGEDDAEVEGIDAVAACEFARRLDITGPADLDGDGVVETLDCNDRNAAIRPGAVDVPGNGVDEDCTGADRPLPLVDSAIRSSFAVSRRGTKVERLTPVDLPRGSRVEVTCRTTVRFRRRCPFTKRTATPAAGRTSVGLVKLFKRRRLPLGTRLEIRITAEGYVGKVVRLTVRRAALPRAETLCLTPGARTPSKCPTEDR